MKKLVLSGNALLEMGFPQSPVIGKVIELAAGFPEAAAEEVYATLRQVLENPAQWQDDALYGPVATLLLPAPDDTIELRETMPYAIYGEDFIEGGARRQMEVAMQLPVSVAGALMPDAHQGYGLPIGGVLAVNNAVIPYGVGVDIGCRMCLSIFDIPATDFTTREAAYKRELIAHTQFGAGAGFVKKHRADHAVLSDAAFQTNALVKSLLDKAWSQLGSSGSGNHFVEWGIIEVMAADNSLQLPPGRFLALLSHSGSRGLGATIAGHYTRVAKERCRLPKEAANLAYLGLDTADGQEYWQAMTLAGDYASACHEVIHTKLTQAIGGTLLARVENHHNFAWKEMLNGQEVVVHRKGATPASAGTLGIIPGSMTAPGFLVEGKGAENAVFSASHGAGRQMSRTQATKTFTRDQLTSLLQEQGVTLIGGGLDEAPGAYKDIHTVMAAQQDLVKVLATFTPKMVRMAE